MIGSIIYGKESFYIIMHISDHGMYAHRIEIKDPNDEFRTTDIYILESLLVITDDIEIVHYMQLIKKKTFSIVYISSSLTQSIDVFKSVSKNLAIKATYTDKDANNKLMDFLKT